MNLRWRDLQYFIEQMSESDKNSPVLVLNSLFDRRFEVRAIDHLDTYKTGKRTQGEPVVLVIDNAQA